MKRGPLVRFLAAVLCLALPASGWCGPVGIAVSGTRAAPAAPGASGISLSVLHAPPAGAPLDGSSLLSPGMLQGSLHPAGSPAPRLQAAPSALLGTSSPRTVLPRTRTAASEDASAAVATEAPRALRSAALGDPIRPQDGWKEKLPAALAAGKGKGPPAPHGKSRSLSVQRSPVVRGLVRLHSTVRSKMRGRRSAAGDLDEFFDNAEGEVPLDEPVLVPEAAPAPSGLKKGFVRKDAALEETPAPARRGGASVAGQTAAAWASAALSAAGIYAGIQLLGAAGWVQYAAFASLGAGFLLAPAALSFISAAFRTGIAVGDYLDSQIDPRDREGEMRKLIRPGAIRAFFMTRVVGPDAESPAFADLAPHVRRFLEPHRTSRAPAAFVRQFLRSYRYLAAELVELVRLAGGLGRLFREMAFGESEMAPLLKPYRKAINVSRGLLIAKAFINTGSAFMAGALTDAAIARDPATAAVWLGSIVALTLVRMVVRKIFLFNTGKLRVQLRRDFRVHLFGYLLRMPLSFTEAEDPARLAARLTADVSRLTVRNITIPIQFPHHVIQLGLALGFVFYTSWELSFLILLTIPILAGLSWFYGHRSARYNEDLMTSRAALTSTGDRILSQTRQIRSVSAERAMTKRYMSKADRLETIMLKEIRLGSTFNSMLETLQSYFYETMVMGFGFLSHILTGAPSIGQVVALRGYSKDARASIDGVLKLYTSSKSSEGATKRILSYLREAPAAGDEKAKPAFEPKGGSIGFEDVSYSLAGKGLLLDRLSVHAGAQEHVAVLGDRPAARRAIVDLLLRLDEAAQGAVKVDGQDVSEVDRGTLQEHMAILNREPILFPADIRGTLAFGNPRPLSDGEIERAVAEMGASFLFDAERFPEGLDTEIEAGMFNEEERQRISLARAYLRDAQVLIVDGAGQGLSPRRAEGLLRSVRRAAEGRTLLMVNIPYDWTHSMDRIVVLENGRVADEGRPAELISSGRKIRGLSAPDADS